MRIVKKSLILLLSAHLLAAPARPCTAFVIRRGQLFMLAKNLDWPVGLGHLLINQPGIRKTALTAQSEPWHWTSEYGSITFNQFGRDLPLGGMNEKGLAIEELNAPPWNSEICFSPELNEFQLVQYILDNFQSVEELIDNLNHICLCPQFIHLHYLVLDATGDRAVIEMVGETLKVITGPDLPYPVLSNNYYGNSIKYLKNFEGFGGSSPIKIRSGSIERFVTVCHLLSRENAEESLAQRAFQILDTVKQADTQWSIVYDCANRRITFRISPDAGLVTIDLKDLDFRQSGDQNYLNLDSHLPGEIRIADFSPETVSSKVQLIQSIKNQLISSGMNNTETLAVLDTFIKYQKR